MTRLTVRGIRRLFLPAAPVALAAAVVLAALAAPLGAEVTDDEVRQCIARAVAKLKDKQKVDGHWEHVKTQAASGGYGGMTALATLALLQAGVPLEDKAVVKGLKALEDLPNRETYVASLRLMAFAKADQVAGTDRYRKEIEAAVRWLQSTQSAIGTWGYEAGDIAGDKQSVIDNTDNSNTQMALLALYEAARAGYKVDDPAWKRSEDYFVRTQGSDGSWGYRHAGPGPMQLMPRYGSMTAAGLATLFITGSRLQQATDCGCTGAKGRGYRNSQPIAQGLSWLAKNFTVEKNPGLEGNTWHFYWLYALERVGIISGLKTIGNHDWFREGADYLVRRQLADGGFARSADRGGEAPDYDTALAILFLAKGHVPALASKLRWSGRNEDWNWNLYDLENLTRWIGTRLNGRAVGWQTVSMSDPLEVWLKAPMLYVSGRRPPKLSGAEKKKLRAYVAEGGTILADACCDSKEFTEAMRSLAAELFPEGQLAALPESHPVYHSVEALPGKWPIEGLVLGCRTSLLLSPKDLSCSWELASRPESRLGLKMGLNLAAYATARQPLPDRLAAVAALEATPETRMERGALYVGKVRHHGRDWNSRPRAMDRLLEHLRTTSAVKVASRAVPVGLGDDQAYRFPVLYMVGHYDPALTADEKRRLKDYLERGGFLFAEACCGMPEFDKGFRALMAELFPDAPLEEVPATSPLLSGQAGYRIDTVRFSAALGKEQPKLDRPLLLAVTLDDRCAAVYSPYALGPGLDGIATFHSRGYAPDAAFRIGTNVLLYALKF